MSDARKEAKARITKVVEKWSKLYTESLQPELKQQYDAGADTLTAKEASSNITRDSNLGEEMHDAVHNVVTAYRTGMKALESTIEELFRELYPKATGIQVKVESRGRSGGFPIDCEVTVWL